MAEKDIVRKIVPYKNVVRDPGFNYRKDIPPVPEPILKYIKDELKKEDGDPFNWEILDKMIDDSGPILPGARVKLVWLLELAQSIQGEGLLQPIIVRESGALRDDARTYFLVAGERRYQACGILGLGSIEVKVCKGDMQELKMIRLTENVQRVNPDPYEEATAIFEYIEACRAIDPGYQDQECAKKMGKTPGYISQRLTILKKTVAEVREAAEAGEISTAHVRELSVLPPTEQKTILKDIKEKHKEGKKVSAADIKDKADLSKVKAKAEKAEKAEKAGKAPKDDKVKEAKDALAAAVEELGYKIKELRAATMRTKQEAIETLSVVGKRLKGATSERSKWELKGKMTLLEWLLRVRESF